MVEAVISSQWKYSLFFLTVTFLSPGRILPRLRSSFLYGKNFELKERRTSFPWQTSASTQSRNLPEHWSSGRSHLKVQPSTDRLPLHVPFSYVSSTYENDIALIRLEKLPFTEECLEENPAVRPVCVPWTTQLFPPNHTCSISGWGRTAGTNVAAGNRNVGDTNVSVPKTKPQKICHIHNNEYLGNSTC